MFEQARSRADRSQLLDPPTLRHQLLARGLELLGVGRHHGSPEILIVYLHGNAGQWRDGAARMMIAAVPGVLTVTESVPSASILLVRVGPVDPDAPAQSDTDRHVDTRQLVDHDE